MDLLQSALLAQVAQRNLLQLVALLGSVQNQQNYGRVQGATQRFQRNSSSSNSDSTLSSLQVSPDSVNYLQAASMLLSQGQGFGQQGQVPPVVAANTHQPATAVPDPFDKLAVKYPGTDKPVHGWFQACVWHRQFVAEYSVSKCRACMHAKTNQSLTPVFHQLEVYAPGHGKALNCKQSNGWTGACRVCRCWTAGVVELDHAEEIPCCRRCQPTYLKQEYERRSSAKKQRLQQDTSSRQPSVVPFDLSALLAQSLLNSAQSSPVRTCTSSGAGSHQSTPTVLPSAALPAQGSAPSTCNNTPTSHGWHVKSAGKVERKSRLGAQGGVSKSASKRKAGSCVQDMDTDG